MDLSLNKNEKKNTQENIQVSSETKKKKTQKTFPNSSHNCVTRKRRTAHTTSEQEIDKTHSHFCTQTLRNKLLVCTGNVE